MYCFSVLICFAYVLLVDQGIVPAKLCLASMAFVAFTLVFIVHLIYVEASHIDVVLGSWIQCLLCKCLSLLLFISTCLKAFWRLLEHFIKCFERRLCIAYDAFLFEPCGRDQHLFESIEVCLFVELAKDNGRLDYYFLFYCIVFGLCPLNRTRDWLAVYLLEYLIFVRDKVCL